MNHAEGNKKMNRKEFIKIMGAVATAAALGNIGFAEEGKKKMKVNFCMTRLQARFTHFKLSWVKIRNEMNKKKEHR